MICVWGFIFVLCIMCCSYFIGVLMYLFIRNVLCVNVTLLSRPQWAKSSIKHWNIDHTGTDAGRQKTTDQLSMHEAVRWWPSTTHRADSLRKSENLGPLSLASSSGFWISSASAKRRFRSSSAHEESHSNLHASTHTRVCIRTHTHTHIHMHTHTHTYTHTHTVNKIAWSGDISKM